MKKILIIGGGGFIGYHLTNKFRSKQNLLYAFTMFSLTDGIAKITPLTLYLSFKNLI